MITKKEVKEIYATKFTTQNWRPECREATEDPMVECVKDVTYGGRCERYLKIKYNKKVSIYLKFDGFSTLERFIRMVEVDTNLEKEIGEDYFI